MKRLGGYRQYWSAYQRELVADARPLDDRFAGALGDGTHDVEVAQYEAGLAHLRVQFKGVGGRRVWARLVPGDPRTAAMVEGVGGSGEPGPGEWSYLGEDLLGTRWRVRVERGGEVDVLVCADRTYLVVAVPGGEVRAQLNKFEEVDQWLTTNSASRVRPRITRILGIGTGPTAAD